MAAVGAGFIILAVIWIICILLCLVLARCEGPVAYAGILCILAAIIVTLVLWFYPRGTESIEPYVVYDYTYIPRTTIVCVLAVMLFVGTLVVAAFHLFDQHRGTPIKPWAY